MILVGNTIPPLSLSLDSHFHTLKTEIPSRVLTLFTSAHRSVAMDFSNPSDNTVSSDGPFPAVWDNTYQPTSGDASSAVDTLGDPGFDSVISDYVSDLVPEKIGFNIFDPKWSSGVFQEEWCVYIPVLREDATSFERGVTTATVSDVCGLQDTYLVWHEKNWVQNQRYLADLHDRLTTLPTQDASVATHIRIVESLQSHWKAYRAVSSHIVSDSMRPFDSIQRSTATARQFVVLKRRKNSWTAKLIEYVRSNENLFGPVKDESAPSQPASSTHQENAGLQTHLTRFRVRAQGY